jgi:hypothetical protein
MQTPEPGGNISKAVLSGLVTARVYPVCMEADLTSPQNCHGEEGLLLKAEDVRAFGAVAADIFEYER